MDSSFPESQLSYISESSESAIGHRGGLLTVDVDAKIPSANCYHQSGRENLISICSSSIVTCQFSHLSVGLGTRLPHIRGNHPSKHSLLFKLLATPVNLGWGWHAAPTYRTEGMVSFSTY